LTLVASPVVVGDGLFQARQFVASSLEDAPDGAKQKEVEEKQEDEKIGNLDEQGRIDFQHGNYILNMLEEFYKSGKEGNAFYKKTIFMSKIF
jgi:hypothetical protein